MKHTWKALVALALLASGILMVGCGSDSDAGPTNNGGAEVSEETKTRLKTVTDDASGGGQEASSDTVQAAPPPTGE